MSALRRIFMHNSLIKTACLNIHYLTCTCSSHCLDGDYDSYQEQNDFVPPIDQIEERMRKVEGSQAAIEY